MGATWHVEASVHCPVGGPGDPGPYSGADSFTFVRLLLRDPDGVEGTGVTGRFLAPEVAHFLNRVVPDVLNRGSHDPVGDIAKQFNPRQMGGVVVSGLSALDIALTDIRAKRSGQSVASLLGGQRRAAPVHVTCGFPELDTDALVESCGREVAAGALGVKVLIAAKGRTVAQDLARLSGVREAIGPRAELIADANCRMDVEAALAFLRGAGDLNLTWLEEPVRGNDTAGLAALAGQGVPLGAGQMEQSLERFGLLAGAGVKVLQPNAVFIGGFGPAIDAAQLGMNVSPAGGWDIINLHWVCGALASGAVELHRAQSRIVRLLMPEGISMIDGQIHVPDKAGLGLSPDEAGLAACRIG
ncbi:mandelate racemase/muconate lactonizing enzyme family protein [Thalassobacter stenotrophicus]|uniref:enolase C-terminal domain-like protein n=1 Tax=Thalassobacter stenotrophicus TaxID=266809 RepID=UPI0022A987CA|nr:enolase C-terminal domain-like protein [Thalassobacter stenotrophicus]UYP69304.1 mandelate racemase/muconate lactonizing enzyme family protein [Thalassobacter stenotrophicus]